MFYMDGSHFEWDLMIEPSMMIIMVVLCLFQDVVSIK